MYRSESYYDFWELVAAPEAVWAQKVRTSSWLLRQARRVSERPGPSLLDVGCAHGFMLAAARDMGFAPVGVEISPAAEEAKRRGFAVVREAIEVADLGRRTFDVVTMVDFIEHVADPNLLMTQVQRLTCPGSLVLIVTPDVSSAGAKILRSRWPQYRLEHILYFNPRSLTYLLRSHQFDVVLCRTAKKYLTFDFVLGYLNTYEPGRFTSCLNLARRLIPSGLGGLPVPVPLGLFCIARRRKQTSA